MTGKEVLRAIADGVDVSEFEFTGNGEFWAAMPENIKVQSLVQDGHWIFRRKPRTRVVNGFTVPAPIQEMPKHSVAVFEANPSYEQWFDEMIYESEHPFCQRTYSRGLLFSTKEAAIANAKAMVGIDPEAE